MYGHIQILFIFAYFKISIIMVRANLKYTNNEIYKKIGTSNYFKFYEKYFSYMRYVFTA